MTESSLWIFVNWNNREHLCDCLREKQRLFITTSSDTRVSTGRIGIYPTSKEQNLKFYNRSKMSTCPRAYASDSVLTSPQARANSVLTSPQARANPIAPEATTDTKARKRRSRDLLSLGLSAHQSRYEHVTLVSEGKGYLLDGPLIRSDPQSVWRSQHDRAITAAEARWRDYNQWKKSCVEICLASGAILSVSWDREYEGASSPLAPGMSKARKFAIQYFLVEKFGAPAEDDWDAPNFHPTCSLPTVQRAGHSKRQPR